MFELTLSASLSNSLMIEHIKNGIESQIQKSSGIVVSMLHMGKAMLSIAVPANNTTSVKEKIVSLVAKEILQSYKKDIFYSTISSSVMSDENLNIIKYLVYSYENNIDEEIIKKNILLENFLDIDSVYYFRLSESRKRWTSSALTVKNNLPQLLSFYDFPSLCRFLLDGKQTIIDDIYFLISSKNLIVADAKKQTIKSMDIFSINLFCSIFMLLIDIMPMHIYIPQKIKSICPKFNVIEQVFEGKIYYTE